MTRAIIFDCFGVIITDALKAILEDLNQKDPALAQFVRDTVRANNRGFITPEESSQAIAERMDISVDQFHKIIAAGEIKDRRVLELIRSLRKHYKTALLSNIGHQSLGRRFTRKELSEHFDVVIASGDVGIVKPDPAIYRHAAEQLGVVPNECVFLDDLEGHCEGAHSVGMRTIRYQDFWQAKHELEKLLANPEN